jgi:hypothetical protein
MRDKTPPPSGDELLTDAEGAALLNVGLTTWFDLEKRPDFPKAVWLGPRLKRRPRRPLMDWALAQQREPAAEWVEAQQRALDASKAKRKDARRTAEVAS